MQNITNCRVHTGAFWHCIGTNQCNAKLLLCMQAPFKLNLYLATYRNVPLELYSYVPLELYSCATMCASIDWRTCTVSGAWDLSGICFASFMVSPGKLLGWKLPLRFNHFSLERSTPACYGSEECEQYCVRGLKSPLARNRIHCLNNQNWRE